MENTALFFQTKKTKFSCPKDWGKFKETGILDSVQRATFWDQDICSLNDMDNLSLNENFPFIFEVTYLNTTENIISGTFSFVATKEDCHDTIRVTNGRFDIKYAN